MEKLTADARYEKTWHLFLSELERQPRLRLTAYLRSKHVYQRGFEKWMSRHGYSVREAKGRILRLKTESINAGKSSPQCGKSASRGRMAYPLWLLAASTHIRVHLLYSCSTPSSFDTTCCYLLFNLSNASASSR